MKMGLLPSGSNSEIVELIKIETAHLSLVMKGKLPNLKHIALNLHTSEKMFFNCTGKNIERIEVFDRNVNKLTPHGEHSPIFFENELYELLVISKENKQLTFYHEHPRLRTAVSASKIGTQNFLTGTLHFQNEIGFSTFEIYDGTECLLSVTIEIFPTKLDYKEDYRRLLHEVNDEIYNLAYHFLKKTYLHAGSHESTNPTMSEFYRLLEHYFTRFMHAVEQIKRQPHHELTKQYDKVRGEKIKRMDSFCRSYLHRRPYLFVETKNGIHIHNKTLIPTAGLTIKKEISFDTLENRFVKWMMQRLNYKMQDLYKEIQRPRRFREHDPDEHLTKRIVKWMQQIENELSRSFWREIGELDRSIFSLVIQMAPGYRDAFEMYTLMLRGLSLEGIQMKMSVKDVAKLYEYWTFIKLSQILAKKYLPIEQDIIKVNNNGLYLTLDESRTAKQTFIHPKTKEKITLYYQKSVGNLPTVTQKPDMVLTLEKQGKSYTYNYIFDAKYRIDYSDTSQPSPGPLEEDINTMHRYRDALVSEQNGPYERTAFGAYVLFPWNQEELYEQHHFYKSIEKVNIGGFPFLPNSTRLLEQFIDHLVEKSSEEIQKEGILPRGTYEEWQSSLDERVLVGVVRNDKQLQANLKYGFYHIPVQRLKSGWQEAKYVALYITKYISEKENGILYYAKIKDVQIVKRCNIKELPSQSQDEYVKFILEPWEKLERIIRPVRYGIQVYTMTTLNTLKSAHTLPELFMKSREEVTLWRMLRRLTKDIQIELNDTYLDRANEIKAFRFNNVTIKMERDNKILKLDNGIIEKNIPFNELIYQPTKVFKEIINSIE
jgi:uncharacterized protein